MHAGGIPRIVNISIEEERELLSNLTFSNRQKLIESYIPLVKMIIKKYYVSYDKEELLSFGLEELIKCIDKFSESKQNSLYHYTFLRLKAKMLYYLKKETERKNNEEILSAEILSNQNLEEDFIVKDENDIRWKKVLEYLKTLREEDYKILYMYYNLGYTHEKIGELLNYKANTISYKRLRLISRIKVFLFKNGLFNEEDLNIDEKKMARRFKNPTYEEVMPSYMLKKEHPSNNILEKEKRLEELIKKDNLEDISKYLSDDEVNTIFKLLKSDTLRGVFGSLSIEDFFIICLKFGFINGRSYTSEEIANFLNINIEKVISLTKDVLINYKKVLACNGTIRTL